MRIAIIGSGGVGRGLATALGRAGHAITFGRRTPSADQPDEASVAEAVGQADATILAVPFSAVADVVRSADGFDGKIVIDATNPLAVGDGGLGLSVGFNGSGAEQIAALAPGALVFKTFNQTGFENLTDARTYTCRPVMFVAGDDGVAKATVLELVSDAGFEGVDAGALRAARLLEPLAMLWIELARKRGHGSDFVFTLQRKGQTS